MLTLISSFFCLQHQHLVTNHPAPFPSTTFPIILTSLWPSDMLSCFIVFVYIEESRNIHTKDC